MTSPLTDTHMTVIHSNITTTTPTTTIMATTTTTTTTTTADQCEASGNSGGHCSAGTGDSSNGNDGNGEDGLLLLRQALEPWLYPRTDGNGNDDSSSNGDGNGVGIGDGDSNNGGVGKNNASAQPSLPSTPLSPQPLPFVRVVISRRSWLFNEMNTGLFACAKTSRCEWVKDGVIEVEGGNETTLPLPILVYIESVPPIINLTEPPPSTPSSAPPTPASTPPASPPSSALLSAPACARRPLLPRRHPARQAR